MTLNIEKETEIPAELNYEAIIRAVVTAAADCVDCPYEFEVNVILTTDEEICRVNADYRGIDNPTDVLSFPMVSYTAPADFSILETDAAWDCFHPESGELLLGDIMLSMDRTIQQAETYGHSLARELGFLIAHSMLHLFGYDHMEVQERTLMEEKQREIMHLVHLSRDEGGTTL